MVGTVIFILVFIFAGETLGASLIAGFSFLQYWFVWLAMIVAMFVFGVSSIITRFFSNINDFKMAGAIATATTSSFIFGVAKYIIGAVIAYYLSVHIDPSILSFNELGAKEIVAGTAALLLLWI